MQHILTLLLLLAGGAAFAANPAARLKAIDHKDGVVRIRLDAPTTWHTTSWRSAGRFIVEVAAVGASERQQILPVAGPRLKAVRWAQFTPNTVRVVLDLNGTKPPVVLSRPPTDFIEIVADPVSQPKPPDPPVARPADPDAGTPPSPPPPDEAAPDTARPPPERAPNVSVTDITVERDENQKPTRIVVRTDGPTDLQPEWRDNHLVLNLPGTVPGEEHIVPVNDDALVRVYAARERGHAAIVADFTRRVVYSVMPLDEGSGFAVSLGLDTAPADEAVELAPNFKALSGKIIVLDPGHGGRDTGTRGPFVIEKTVNLDIALRLERVLISNGARVILTRRDDTLTPLRRRPEIAMEAHADAFVSVHCNYASSNHHGVEVWYRRDDGASRRLSTDLYRSYLAATGFSGRGVKPESHAPEGGLAVLKHNSVPCALVELGFVNDPQEGKAMAVPSWRRKAAEGLAGGLARFLERVN